MKKMIALLLTVATVLSLSVCSFAQTENTVKDADKTWKEYIAELKDILTEGAKEKAKEKRAGTAPKSNHPHIVL